MIPSIAGLLVCALIMAGATLAGAPVLVSLLASLAFGSTAFATLPALGGSSPLISVVFVAIAALTALFRRRTFPDLLHGFAEQRISWIVLALLSYAIGSSIILPRLFAGQTTAFVAARVEGAGAVVEVPLEPTNSNVTQTGYLVLGCATFYIVLLLLNDRQNFERLRKGLFAFASLVGLMAVIEIAGKKAGLGDVFGPIRTASFSMLTESSESGLFRLTGGFPESSSFSQAALAALAFTYTYWRASRSRAAMLLASLLFVMLLLSTSSTAYVGLGILTGYAGFGILITAHQGRMRVIDAALLAAAVIAVTALFALYLYDSRLFDTANRLLETMVFNKLQSSSGVERAYWNERSIQAFFDTSGLGIGMGSSRSSSWLVSIIAQLGVVGMGLFGALLFEHLRPMPAARRPQDTKIEAMALAMRSSALASIIAITLSGGSADPGYYFFICTAGVIACRQHLEREQPAPFVPRVVTTGPPFGVLSEQPT